ncbi:MAG: DUF4249 family protein [Saprospiraceae bacterium]|nr:DUF4249 family protein [Saprospiraceae bacterium]
MKKFTLAFVIFLLMMFNRCIDPYTYETADYQPKVLVEGVISNLPGPYIINIFKSEPYLTNNN